MRTLLFTLLCLGVFCVNGFAQGHVDTKDRIAAIVNDEVITQSELQQELQTFLPQLRTQYRGEELQQQTDQLRYKLLVTMIEQKLQLQQAAQMRLTVSDRDINSTVQTMRKRRGADPEPESTERERQAAKDQLLLMRVYQHKVRNTLLIPEATLQEYYDSHQEEFTLPGEVSISQIMLSIDGSGTLEKARLRTDHVLKELERGRTFEELAKDYSDGPEARDGGSLGTMTRGSLLPQMEEIIDQFGPGEIGPVIKSQAGFHIIRVDEKTPAGLRPFEEAKSGIESKLLQEQSQQVYQEWLNDLKDNAFIDFGSQFFKRETNEIIMETSPASLEPLESSALPATQAVPLELEDSLSVSIDQVTAVEPDRIQMLEREIEALTQALQQTRILLLTTPFMRGEDVAALQRALGFSPDQIDSIFGKHTDRAVKVFQEQAGMIVDGKVGLETLNALASWPDGY